MGLKPEDTVLIHSSMKSIGQVDGGADAVLEAWEYPNGSVTGVSGGVLTVTAG